MIKCEICSRNDIIKENGTFVCQSCGCKYSVEDMRKMVDSANPIEVKISRTADITRIKKMADTAYDNSSWEDAAKYYTQLLEIYDGDYESNFRCLFSKIHVWGNNQNGFPHLGKSIKIALDSFSDSAEQKE